MNDQCPKCSGPATITHGRFRDLTSARFDTEYTDGVYGMTRGVKIACPVCGEINLSLEAFNMLINKEIDAREIDEWRSAYPTYRGVIPLISWSDSRNRQDIN
ncbi:hypothetical protein [Trabulsiella guamensis]|uniref:hypothetical protein n=1 Tax=Trabulsiella guamensis TaxID=158852 RepID=UPI0012EB1C93|nr:hypothetical protein [Trabulsiella guamensis]